MAEDGWGEAGGRGHPLAEPLIYDRHSRISIAILARIASSLTLSGAGGDADA